MSGPRLHTLTKVWTPFKICFPWSEWSTHGTHSLHLPLVSSFHNIYRTYQYLSFVSNFSYTSHLDFHVQDFHMGPTWIWSPGLLPVCATDLVSLEILLVRSARHNMVPSSNMLPTSLRNSSVRPHTRTCSASAQVTHDLVHLSTNCIIIANLTLKQLSGFLTCLLYLSYNSIKFRSVEVSWSIWTPV